MGLFTATSSLIQQNNRNCGDTSGVGIALLGATGVRIQQNRIIHNRPTGFGASGGVIVLAGAGGTASSGNLITQNTILGNSPDLFWDQRGTGNVFSQNTCHSSVPPGLCRL